MQLREAEPHLISRPHFYGYPLELLPFGGDVELAGIPEGERENYAETYHICFALMCFGFRMVVGLSILGKGLLP